MVMGDFGDLWSEATVDHAAEQRTAALTAAGVDAQAIWPFLAAAQTQEEFGTRLALAEDSINAVAARHGISYEEVAGPFARGWKVAHPVTAASRCSGVGQPMKNQSERSTDQKFFGYALGECPDCGKKVRSKTNKTPQHNTDKESSLHTAGASCANCGHSNASHDRGSACPDCGCQSFQPKTASRKQASQCCEQCGEDLGDKPTASFKVGGKDYTIHKSCVADAKAEHESSLKRQAGKDSEGRYVYKREDIKPGWGAHVGDGQWLTRCPEAGCDHFIEGKDGNAAYPVDIQRHLSDAHQKSAPLLPGGKESSLQRQATDPGSAGGPSGHKDHANPEFTNEGFEDLSNPEFGTPGGGPADGGYGPNPYDGGNYGGGAGVGVLASLHRALMEGQDPLEWIQAQNPPGGPQNALVPSHHDTVQSFTGQPGTAYREALDNDGGSGSGDPSAHHPTQTVGSRKTASLGLSGMANGEERVFHLPGDEGDPSKHFEVSYHSEQANGDNGQPARGFTTGSFMVKHPVNGGGYEFFRHTPHGPGLDSAKPHAAENAESFITNHLRQMRRVKEGARLPF